MEFSCTGISCTKVSDGRTNMSRVAYHLEVVDFLLDLLSKHWGEAIARRNLSSTIVLTAWPCLVELDPRTECGITLDSSTLRSSWHTLGVSSETQGRHEVVFTA